MTIEAQLDTIAQHLLEIKQLLRAEKQPAAPVEKQPAAPVEPAQDPDEYANATLEDCTEAARTLVKSADDGSGVGKLSSILQSMNAKKVTELKPTQFAAFMRAVNGA
jgi:hypothetical protein